MRQQHGNDGVTMTTPMWSSSLEIFDTVRYLLRGTYTLENYVFYRASTKSNAREEYKIVS